MQKLLTVIVPSYNMEKYLPKCLGSLLVAPELMERLEILVVNDGSKDRTSEIAHAFEARYPGVFRVIDKPNGNYGSCVNAALPVMKGRFVKMLDADDSYDTDSFAVYLRALDEMSEDVDAIMNDYVIVDETGAATRTICYSLPVDRSFSPNELAVEKYNIAMHAICYRAELLRKMDYRQTEGISYTDTEWTFFPMAKARTVRYLPHCVYRYLVGRAGQTMETATFVKRRHELMRILDGMLAFYRDEKCDQGENRDYLQGQINRLVGVVVHLYMCEVPICAIRGFFMHMNDIARDYPFVEDELSCHLLFEHTPMRWKCFSAATRHAGLSPMIALFVRTYSRLRAML